MIAALRWAQYMQKPSLHQKDELMCGDWLPEHYSRQIITAQKCSCELEHDCATSIELPSAMTITTHSFSALASPKELVVAIVLVDALEVLASSLV